MTRSISGRFSESGVIMLHSTNWVKSLDAVNVHWKVITTKQFSMMVISHYHFSAVILPRLAGKPGTKFLHGKKIAHQEGCWRQVDMVPRKVGYHVWHVNSSMHYLKLALVG